MEIGIKGHLTRNKEVVEILEMLGGKNQYKIVGGLENHFYYIGDKESISNSYIGPDEIKGYEIFSVEEFWEKFPYKVGDKVNVYVNYEHFAGPRAELEEAEIKSMRWNSARCEVAYRMKDQTGEFYKSDIKGKVNDENLFHTINEYEEIVEKSFQGGYEKCKSDIKLNGYELPDGYHFVDENGNVIDAKKIHLVKNSPIYPETNDDEEQQIDLSAEILKSMNEETVKRRNEFILETLYTAGITHEFLEKHGFTLPDGYHFADRSGNPIDTTEIRLVKNPPYYPKTYDECCEMLDADEFVGHEFMREFPKLINARNAYWKIAGEWLELDKPWEPDWTNEKQPKYGLYQELKDTIINPAIFVFPTEEMRDAFYDNFKDLIELCKSLL